MRARGEIYVVRGSVSLPRSLGILPVEEREGIISGGEGVVTSGDLQLTAAEDRASERLLN